MKNNRVSRLWYLLYLSGSIFFTGCVVSVNLGKSNRVVGPAHQSAPGARDHELLLGLADSTMTLEPAPRLTGSWTGHGEWVTEEKVAVWMPETGWSSTSEFKKGIRLRPLKEPAAGGFERVESEGEPLRFILQRDPGILVLEAETIGHRESFGTFVAELAPEFVQAAGEAGVSGGWDALVVVDLILEGIDLAYIEQCASLVDGITWHELLRMRRSGVSIEYLEKICTVASEPVDGEEWVEALPAPVAFSTDDVIELRMHGVSAEYVQAICAAGYPFGAQEIIDLRMRGVSTEFATELMACGYRLSAEEIVDLRMRGVSTEFACGMKTAGYDFSAGDLITLRMRGVTVDYASRMVTPGYALLSADELVRLRMRGVEPEFVRALRRAPEPADQ